jgi:hypothetical protein
VLLFAIACGGSDPVRPLPRPAATPIAPVAPARCGAGVPEAACLQPGIRVCRAGDSDRAGEWRYAVIAGPFEPVSNLTLDQLAAAWRDGKLAASAETQAALEPTLGASTRVERPAPQPVLDASRWAIVPAHELVPSWKVITVDGKHPLATAPDRSPSRCAVLRGRRSATSIRRASRRS